MYIRMIVHVNTILLMWSMSVLFSTMPLPVVGVLLLNACLTVRSGQANSHKDKGWEKFTDAVISWLNKNKKGLVFMLWGSYAQKKGAHIDKVTTYWWPFSTLLVGLELLAPTYVMVYDHPLPWICISWPLL